VGTKKQTTLSKRQQVEFDQQLKAHRHVLRHYIAGHVKSKHDIEGREQDTMLAAWQAYDDFKGDCTFTTWLCGIAKKQILLYYRQPKNSINCLSFDDDIAVSLITTENTCYYQQLLWEVEERIESLPEDYREVMIMYTIEGYTHPEIAQTLGITKRSARVRLLRARKMLARKFRTD